MRIALGLQYDGTRFVGWQTQPSQNTVQDKVEQAIQAFIGDTASHANPIRVTAAGRTDTGVHALGQVVHFDCGVERDPWSWVRGLNSFLPSDIVVNWAQTVNATFDARFSAFERSYVYALHVGPCRAPSVASRAGYLMLAADQWLDTGAMQMASQCLWGSMTFPLLGHPSARARRRLKRCTTFRFWIKNPGFILWFGPMPFCTIWFAISWAVCWPSAKESSLLIGWLKY